MARKRVPEPPAPEPELTTAREEADRKVAERIGKGQELAKRDIHTSQDIPGFEDEFAKWNSYNRELLTRLFTTDKFAKEYSYFGVGVVKLHPPSHAERVFDTKKNFADKISRLESIKERLELIPVASGVTAARAAAPQREHTNRVFIVHGHDQAARETVARFLERLGVQAIILHEQANVGRTIIEKLEHHSDVDFAVIILTPDDVGNSATQANKLNPRARQNVILELGYFVGKLGRSNVCALYQAALELPTDYVGVGYVSMDPGGGWRLSLAKELRTAGFDIDMNLAL
jgi:predicted nucleotide-binding protein